MTIGGQKDNRDETMGHTETPHLGSKINDTGSESFLNKHDGADTPMMSNHLYQFAAPVYKQKQQTEMGKFASRQVKAKLNLHDEFIEGIPAVDSRVKNGDHRRTPIQINTRNAENGQFFDIPLQQHNSAAKLIKFQTPSTEGESITTATSIRKLSSKVVQNNGVRSPPESRLDSMSGEMGIRLRYTPESGTKNNLIKQSLERIDNAVKRYDKRVELQNLRDYLQSEEGSCPDDYLAKHVMLNPDAAPNRQAFSDNVSDSIV